MLIYDYDGPIVWNWWLKFALLHFGEAYVQSSQNAYEWYFMTLSLLSISIHEHMNDEKGKNSKSLEPALE